MEFVLIFLAGFVVLTLYKGIRIVPQGYKWIVQRLGKYHTTLQPGLNFIIPYVDTVAYKAPPKTSCLTSQAKRSSPETML